MAKKGAGKKGEAEDGIKTISRNRQALHDFDIVESWECGLVLTGTEVKSLRENQANLSQSYGRYEDGEVWLLGCEIPEYALGHQFNHKPKRARKLLLHRSEIQQIEKKVTERGFTLVPLEMYFKKGIAKVRLALAKGKQLFDKRQTLKKNEAKREIERALKKGKR